MRKELGKIKKAEYGFGGYQDTMMGLTLQLGGESWGVGDFIRAEETPRLKKLLIDTKSQSVAQLVNKPIEITFDGNVMKEWRVLTEVL